MNLRMCPLVLMLQKLSVIDNFQGDKAALVKIVSEFLKKWSHLLTGNLFQLSNSIELDQLLVDYDNFFKEIMRVRKELKKHVEVSPIVVRKGVNVRSHLLHRSACVSALRLIIMSTLGGAQKQNMTTRLQVLNLYFALQPVVQMRRVVRRLVLPLYKIHVYLMRAQVMYTQ